MNTLIALLFLACTGYRATASTVTLFNSDHDLSSTLINKVCYDHDGFVWIATEDGLNRYDGSKVTVYKNNPHDSTSLAHNFVNDVYDDGAGHLLVATHGGLQCYDQATDAFTPIARDSNGNPYNHSTSRMIRRANGDLFSLGVQPLKVEFVNGGLVVNNANMPSEFNGATNPFEDIDGSLWVTKDKNGLYRLLPNGSVKHYFGKYDDPIITCFALGQDNILYAGSQNHGLYRYDRVKDSFESMAFDTNMQKINIKSIYRGRHGGIVLATDGAGLKRFDPNTGKTVDLPLPLPGHNRLKIHTITRDEFDNYWIGIYQKGLLMLPALENDFMTISQRDYESSLIGSACVSAIYRDRNDNIWIGTDNDGLYIVKPDLSGSRHLQGDCPNVITCIAPSSDNRVWVGSFENGLGWVDGLSGRYNKVKVVDENGIDVQRVMSIAEGPNHTLLIATMGSGLFEYNLHTNTVTKNHNVNANINPWITSVIYSTKDNAYYIGTYDGYYCINQDNTVKHLKDGIIVNSIYEDTNRNALWLATSDGLARTNGDRQIEKIYTSFDGMASNSAYSIEDDGENLWIGTNSGLTRFDPEALSFSNYYVDDGLQSNEFFKNSSFHDVAHNLMFFGGVNGVTFFNPDKVISNGRKYQLRITDFYIGSLPVKAGMKSGSRTIIDEPVQTASLFRLAHSDNSFSVEFNTREFNRSPETYFLYSFDNGSWKKMPKKNSNTSLRGANTLTFSNIESGRHTLKIKAIDNGVESDPVSISIDIAIPWYKSWWARLIYACLALTILFVVYSLMRRKEKEKKLEEQRRHEEEIKEAKLQFFTNISHEIRTPLTLVISPLQHLITSDDADKERQSLYRTMLRNARRILRLVNELMDLRKIDNQQMKLRYQKVHLKGFVNDVFETFVQAAQQKNIDFTFTCEGSENIEAWVDLSNFDKIIMNLLSNAVKYTPEGGTIQVAISQGDNPNAEGPLQHYAQVTVTDTGIGIPENERKHIFERFYQVANNNSKGSGIGLHLTHSLVQLHHGEITIEDNPAGEGTRFVVRIPLGSEHLNPDEIATQTDQKPIDAHVHDTDHVPEIVTPASVDKTAEGAKRSKTIYIAEDDPEVRQYLFDALSREFKVQTFADGEPALEAIYREVPDLVITDVMMPTMDGLTLTRKIRKNVNFNHIPIVMLTAKNREEDNLEGLESGVDVYVTKPFNIDILIHTIQNLISSHQRLKNVYGGKQNQENKIEDIDAVSNDEKLLERVMKVVNKHISDSEITVEMIAEEIGISRVHLHRKLKELTNQTTRDFIRNIRLKAAAKLLREKKLTVAEVSYLVGFKHPNNFSTNFKDMYGMSPSTYSEQFHDSQQS